MRGRIGAGPGGHHEVPDAAGVSRRVAAEFERARRYERSVTVAVFSLAVPHADPTGDGRPVAAGHASSTTHLCPVVREVVRETDLVVCDPAARRCVVVMPEIGEEEGRRAVARMRQLCSAQLQCPVHGNLAVFPRDGWVFPDLVEAAEKQPPAAPAALTVSRESLGT